MNEKIFKERSGRLAEIGEVLKKLPQEVRHEAFQLLKDYVTEQPTKTKDQDPKAGQDNVPDDRSKEQFFGSFKHDKPADNLKLIAAWFYREYGTDPFSLDELRQESKNIGITIPARPDITLKAARDEGKKLFIAVGKGKFKPTVHGEANLKSTYSVKKGTKSRPQGNE